MRKSGIGSLILAAAMFLSACGGQEGQTTTTETDKNVDVVFKEETDVFALEEGDVSQLVVIGDTIYVEQYVYENELPQEKTDATAEILVGEETVVAEEEVVDSEEILEEGVDTELKYTRKITGFKEDGSVVSRYSKEMNMNSSGGQFTADAEGNIYSMMTEYASYESGDNTDKIYLESISKDGNLNWSIQLNENMPEGEYYYVSSLVVNDHQQIIVDANRGIEVYDFQGNPVKMIEKPTEGESRVVRIREGKLALISSDGNSAHVQTVDVQSGAFGDKIDLPFNYYKYQVMNGNVYDMYLTDDYGVYGYNIKDAEITKIMDFITSDFYASYLYHTSFVNETTFVAYYYDDNGVVLSKFIKVPMEEVKDKTELVLGCYYLDYNVKEKLIAFNKNNEEYRINIKDYSMYDTMDDYTQGLTRLNADIVSGEVPDIMIVSNQMPVESYIAKGIFVDLNTFFEKDTEVKREDLLPNVLEALSFEDGLYQIAPSFNIMTFVGKTADVGKEPGWTMDEALAVLKSKPEGTQLLSEMTASSFVYYNMWICGEQYVDFNKGECYFDSVGFKKVLEYANTLPREIDYTAVMDDESYWEEMESQYRNGKTLLALQYFSGFRDYAYAKQGTFGEDITLIGFPVEDGLGAGLNVNTTFAISALGENQEAAWEFVKTFLTEEHQDSLSYDFPVRISSLKKLEEKAWEKPYNIDEQGNKQEYDDYFYINGMDVPMVPLTKEETAGFMDYIMSLDKLCVYNEALNNIVTEETESYFAGQKSAEEVADVIQSRAKIYVSENR